MDADSLALLERLGHTAIPPRAKIKALRPAARQIVSIARALSGEVRLLIMDEPSAILDEGRSRRSSASSAASPPRAWASSTSPTASTRSAASATA